MFDKTISPADPSSEIITFSHLPPEIIYKICHFLTRPEISTLRQADQSLKNAGATSYHARIIADIQKSVKELFPAVTAEELAEIKLIKEFAQIEPMNKAFIPRSGPY